MDLHSHQFDISEPCGLTYRQLGKLSDEVLMAHLRAGHDDVLAVLFDRFHKLVFDMAVRILQDSGESEDLMQTVFFEIYRTKAQFDPQKGALKGWIIQCAYHRCLNRLHYLELRGLRKRRGFEATGEPIETGSGKGNRSLDPPELARLVEQGLAALTISQRETIQLAFYQGLSMVEIASRIKQPVGNVRHHYYRGLRALRSLFVASGDGESPKTKPEEQVALTDVKP